MSKSGSLPFAFGDLTELGLVGPACESDDFRLFRLRLTAVGEVGGVTLGISILMCRVFFLASTNPSP